MTGAFKIWKIQKLTTKKQENTTFPLNPVSLKTIGV